VETFFPEELFLAGKKHPHPANLERQSTVRKTNEEQQQRRVGERERRRRRVFSLTGSN
jgi:hypothetical protein